MRPFLLAAFLFIAVPNAFAAEDAVTIKPVRQSCKSNDCRDYDAIFFIHGIYGDNTTFKVGTFNWPEHIPQVIQGRKIDVFRIEYRSALVSWLENGVGSMDEIVDALLEKFYDNAGDNRYLDFKRYRSASFIAHSLGGNVVAAFLHSVKSRWGHVERARYPFVVTLGTPINGAEIANVLRTAKRLLGMRDRLLDSLERDNTFLRMMERWKWAETAKARRFDCRPVDLYVGVEGELLPRWRVVRNSSADRTDSPLSIATEIKKFPELNHLTIAKPKRPADPQYAWVERILNDEMKRINQIPETVCHNC
jgi:hypothetical protein